MSNIRKTIDKTQALMTTTTVAALNTSVSSIEFAVWEELEKLGIPFIPQKQEGHYFVDICLPEYNLLIECNGCFFHKCDVCGYEDKDGKKAYDKKRLDWLSKRGYDIAILWEHEIRKDVSSCVKRVLKEHKIIA